MPEPGKDLIDLTRDENNIGAPNEIPVHKVVWNETPTIHPETATRERD